MEIPLSPELVLELTEQAHQRGTTPELVALACLRERFLKPATPNETNGAPGTLADFLAGHLGVLSSSEHVAGGAQMSENTGKKFAAILQEKQRQGKL